MVEIGILKFEKVERKNSKIIDQEDYRAESYLRLGYAGKLEKNGG